MPAAFLLYHRIKGNILPRGTETDALTSNQAGKPTTTGGGPTPGTAKGNGPSTAPDIDSDDEIAGVINARLVWGPFHLPRIFGIINNLYACCYMVFVIFWSVWPPSTPVTASTMNYSVVVTGGVMILSGIWYFVRAKDVYKGPLIDSEVAEVMRGASVVSRN